MRGSGKEKESEKGDETEQYQLNIKKFTYKIFAANTHWIVLLFKNFLLCIAFRATPLCFVSFFFFFGFSRAQSPRVCFFEEWKKANEGEVCGEYTFSWIFPNSNFCCVLGISIYLPIFAYSFYYLKHQYQSLFLSLKFCLIN